MTVPAASSLAGDRAADETSFTDRAFCRAAARAPQALLELGRRYEEADPATAAFLYARAEAAARAPAPAAIYLPPVRIGGTGRVLMLDGAGKNPSLGEARFRLGRMLVEGRGVAPDAARGRALIEDAARSGHPEAQQWVRLQRSGMER